MFGLTRAGLFQWVAFLAGVACFVLVFETINELQYKSTHHYGSGTLPEVIAWVAGAGALLALCVVLLAKALAADAREAERLKKQEGREVPR